MEIADSITVRYLSLAILFANAAPPLLPFAIFEQFQSICNLQRALRGDCMSSEHFGQLAWQFKRMSGSSGLKVQAAIAC